LVAEYKRRGYAVLAQDECSTIVGWGNKSGWLPRGEEITVPTTLSGERFYTFGVLGHGLEFHTFYEKANGDNFLEFIGKVHRTFGRCVIFLDNASYHKSKAVRDAVGKFCGDVILEYFLPYTPDLNPVETQWREQKRHTAGRQYQGVKDMQRSIDTMYETGEIKTVKTYDYLTAPAT